MLSLMLFFPLVGFLQMLHQTFAAIAQRGQAAGGPALGAAPGGGAAGKLGLYKGKPAVQRNWVYYVAPPPAGGKEGHQAVGQ